MFCVNRQKASEAYFLEAQVFYFQLYDVCDCVGVCMCECNPQRPEESIRLSGAGVTGC